MNEFYRNMMLTSLVGIKESAISTDALIREYPWGSDTRTLSAYKDIMNGLSVVCNNQRVEDIAGKTVAERKDGILAKYETPTEKTFFSTGYGEVVSELKDMGINVDMLLAFDDPAMFEQLQRLNKFYNTLINYILVRDDARYTQQAERKAIEYMKKLYGMSLSQLKDFTLPDPKVEAKKIQKEVEDFVPKAKEVLKDRIRQLNKTFLSYKAKGDSATYADYESMYNAVESVLYRENYYDTSDIQVSLVELRKEGVDLANYISGIRGIYTCYSQTEQKAVDNNSKFLRSYRTAVHEKVSTSTDRLSISRKSHVLKGADRYLDSIKHLTLKEYAKLDFPKVDDVIKSEFESYTLSGMSAK